MLVINNTNASYRTHKTTTEEIDTMQRWGWRN